MGELRQFADLRRGLASKSGGGGDTPMHTMEHV